ncbi:hypothetical protein H2201_007351 [Coniosporium apollinis]|uniref:Uncharacterized protein n=1 Tax=Coniosporium apollinis TaxID=61459 RepID=A0ABQ9NR13_9PEZI|nr:hypothetical protein H2201_007351 [Coniosporium apollinis]
MPFDYNFVKDNNVLSDADKDRIICIVLNATVGGGELPIDWDTAATAFGSKSARSFKQSFTDSLKKITKAGGGSHEPGAQATTTTTAAPSGGDGDGDAAEPVTPATKKATPRKRKTKADGEGAEEEGVTPAKKKATPRKKKGETAVKSEVKAEGEGEEDVV